MEIRVVRDYILEYMKKSTPPLVERTLKIAVADRIVTIYGPRRAGKTYYFYQLIKDKKEKSLYLNFEDTRLIDINFKELRELIRTYRELKGEEPEYVFFDEIQNIPKWESAIREILDTRKYKIYVTGSSSKLLSKEIASSLRGRAFSYLLLPFSFSEYLRATKIAVTLLSRDEEAELRSRLNEYLEYGGFPEVVLNEEKDRILKEYYDLLLFRDVIERHNLRSVSLAKFLLSFFVQNFAKEITINKIANFFHSQGKKFGKNTLYDYVDKLLDSVAIFFVPRYSGKIYVRSSWPKKIYLCDLGFARISKFSKDTGRLMENCVFLELLRKVTLKPLLEIYYYKNSRGKEVDFIVKEGQEVKELIQVCFDIDQPDVRDRELRALFSASRELGCEKLIVINWNYEGKEDFSAPGEKKEVIFIPLWKWLLRERNVQQCN